MNMATVFAIHFLAYRLMNNDWYHVINMFNVHAYEPIKEYKYYTMVHELREFRMSFYNDCLNKIC